MHDLHLYGNEIVRFTISLLTASGRLRQLIACHCSTGLQRIPDLRVAIGGFAILS
jgi:hypothetical protein